MTSNRPKALVTGASSGIGAATAVELARRGMAVAVHYFNNEEGGLRTVQAIRDVGGETFPIKADMRQQSEVQRMVAEVLNEFGTLDVLVNNAGSMVGRVPFLRNDRRLERSVPLERQQRLLLHSGGQTDDQTEKRRLSSTSRPSPVRHGGGRSHFMRQPRGCAYAHEGLAKELAPMAFA
jgi:NAD(P)-dependent dehydrogenase (short-subunit alcohol dehydrogenase family)